jgi:hypothetical protein
VTFVEDAELEARCRALADGVEVPLPFSLHALVTAVAEQHGWQISLVSLPDCGIDGAGFCYTVDQRIFSGYLGDAPVWFQLHTVCYYLAALIARDLLPAGQERNHRPADSDLIPIDHPIRELFDVLVTGSDPEAELAASFLIARIERVVGAQKTASMSEDLRQATEARVEALRGHWSRLTAVIPDVSPWPSRLRSPAVSDEMLLWQQQRLVTEICQAERRVASHLRPGVYDTVNEHVQLAGLPTDAADAAAHHLWTVLGVPAVKAGRPVKSLTGLPWIPGDDSGAAAAATAARLRLWSRPDVDDVIRKALWACGLDVDEPLSDCPR